MKPLFHLLTELPVAHAVELQRAPQLAEPGRHALSLGGHPRSPSRPSPLGRRALASAGRPATRPRPMYA
eukprot:scaffold2084_cov365-Prasinococcus_capsulatus_cf.AAC.6